jgi:DNA polymerase-3 subunit epsilon
METAYISFTETGSELLALLLESSEIKTKYPKYNRSQKNNNSVISLFSYEDQKGIIHLAFNKLKLVPSPLMNFYSLQECRNFLENLCKEFELCPKYCHLQTNVTNCFHYQIKECKGVCCDKEAPEDYNKRVREAINSIGLGAENLVIKEAGRTDNEVGFALILEGDYKGIGYLDENQAEELKNAEDYQFYLQPKRDNRDIQKILGAYLRKKEKLKNLENGEISI